MTHESSPYHSVAKSTRLDRLIMLVSEKFAEGQRIDLDLLTADCPEHREQLEMLLPTLEAMADLGSSLAPGRSAQPPKEISGPMWAEKGVLGDFRILGELGCGGMGIVYLAEQISLGRRMALKVLPFASVLDDRQLQRFQREAQAAAHLKHPNIVGVHSVGCERGVHYYAMEYIEGQTLEQVVRELNASILPGQSVDTKDRASQLPQALVTDQFAQSTDASDGNDRSTDSPDSPSPPVSSPADTRPEMQAAISTIDSIQSREFFHAVAGLGIQAARALEYAHEMGVVHRDIKPANLMVDAKGHLSITDFGLAMTQADADLTMTGDVLGTLRYMSPEQLAGRHGILDHRTDVYSLGATLYELLTLRPAMDGGDRQELMRQVAEEEPRRPRQIDRAIPGDLETIVTKALAKEAPSRYGSAGALADDLQRFVEDKPIRAKRPSLVERSAKWSRRHQAAVWVATTFFALAAVGMAVSSLLIAHQRTRAENAYEAERSQRREAQRQMHLAGEQRQVAQNQRVKAIGERNAALENLYIAEMRLAKQDWEKGQIVRLCEILKRYLPRLGRPDLRGWEWYYLLSLCHTDLATLRGHEDWVRSVAWSPDGERLASGSRDGQVIVWEADTGQKLLNLRCLAGVESVVWSPDGKRVAAGGHDRTITVWNAVSGKKLLTLKGHARSVSAVAWSPDGKRLASGDGTVKIWDALTGDELQTLKTETVNTVAWSPDGKWLAHGNRNRDLNLWNLLTDKKSLLQPAHGNDLWSLAWSPDGTRLASGSYSGEVKVWELSTGKELFCIQRADGVESIDWSPDGSSIATATRSQRIRIYDAEKAEETTIIKGHQGWVSAVAWRPDGKRLASGSEDGAIKIWDPFKKQEAVTLPDAQARVVTWGLDENRLYSVGGLATIWNLSTQENLFSWDGPGDMGAWSPDHTKLARRTSDQVVKILNAVDGVEVLTLKTESFGINNLGGMHMAWNPDGTRLAVVAGSGVQIYDTSDGEKIALLGPNRKVRTVRWSPDGSRLASAGWEGTVKLWDAGTWRRLSTLEGHAPDHWIAFTAWSPDGMRLASGGWDQMLKVWDTSSGKELLTLRGHTGHLWCAAWSPDGNRLASASRDGTVRIWDASSGDEMMLLEGNGAAVTWVAWSPSGQQLASVCDDGTIRIWDASPGYESDAIDSLQFDKEPLSRMREVQETSSVE